MKKVDSENILQLVGDKLKQSRAEDEFDIVGKNVAEKLRKLDPTMRIYAEKIIHDALFEAQLGTLNRDAHIIIPQPSETRISQYNDQTYINLQTIPQSNVNSLSTSQYFSQFSE